MYDIDDTDRARRADFERDWAAQHDIPVEDLAKRGYVAFPVLDDTDARPRWEMTRRFPYYIEWRSIWSTKDKATP